VCFKNLELLNTTILYAVLGSSYIYIMIRILVIIKVLV